MSRRLPPLLIVDDEPNMRLSIETMVAEEGYSAQPATSGEQALALLEQQTYFMVISDARLSGLSGYELLGRVRARWPDVPVLMITAYATPKLAVEAIQAGAIDYLAKPFAPEELLHAIGRCAERYALLQENAHLRAQTREAYRSEHIIGDCERMRELRQLIQNVAPTNATVLILGESGTGKELVAGALHSLSGRRQAPYVRINCAAIPETLLESELFGHEKGAFTGALRQRLGRVEEADGGTIFLDEIGDMSRSLQAKLLRFLEDGTFTRVGGNQELQVDVRLISATNRDIVEAIRAHQFREDLFHRLNVVQFRPPPLRDRGRDIALLAEHFLAHFCRALSKPPRTLSVAARQKLAAHSWPGNVRELRNAIERAVILEPGAEIQPGSLPDFRVESQLGRATATDTATPHTLDEAMDRYERELIVQCLERQHFNLTRTAEQLKLTRHSLRYRMNRLNINADALLEEDACPARPAPTQAA
jgi:DNA-binding NtrC family response regulator